MATKEPKNAPGKTPETAEQRERNIEVAVATIER